MSRQRSSGRISRRTALKAGGTLLGGLTLGTTPVVGTSSGRYLMKPRPGASLGNLAIEERLEPLDYVAVSGPEREVEKQSIAYAPDPVLDLDVPAVIPTRPRMPVRRRTSRSTRFSGTSRI